MFNADVHISNFYFEVIEYFQLNLAKVSLLFFGLDFISCFSDQLLELFLEVILAKDVLELPCFRGHGCEEQLHTLERDVNG